jgi:hypothetical protein
MTRTLSGFIARETEAAVAFVQLPLEPNHKPLWIPRKKILATIEIDGYSPSVQLAGESVRRLVTPVNLEVCEVFLAKVGVA